MRQQSADTVRPAAGPKASGQETESGLSAFKAAAEFAASVLYGRNPDEVMDLIAVRAGELAGSARVSIGTLDAGGKTMTLREIGRDAGPASTTCLPVDGTIFSQVSRTSSVAQLTDGKPRLIVPVLGDWRDQIIELARSADASPFSWEETRTVELFINVAAGSYLRARDRAAAERRLAAVMEITQAILQGVDQQEVLQLIVRRAGELVGAAVSAIYIPDPDGVSLRCRAADGVLADELMRWPVPIVGSLAGQTLRTGQPFNLPALADEPGAYQPLIRITNYGPTLILALSVGERQAGVMTMSNMGGGKDFTEEDLAVAQAFAGQAAVCLDYAAVREGLQQLGSPSAIDKGSPEETVAVLARTVVEATHSDAAAIFQLDAEGHLRTMGSFGLPDRFIELMDKAGRLGMPRAPLEAIRTKRVSIRKVHEYLNGLPDRLPDDWVSHLDAALRAASWDTVVAVPLVYQGRAVGALAGYYAKGYQVGDTEVAFLKIVASQAATTLEIMRLFGLAQQKAALEERQRLARELHDSVSQALYGIALGTQTALDLLPKQPGAVAEPLRYVQRLAEAGLAEMRALIFELRPESLEKEGLVAALRRQAALLRARYEIAVVEELCDEPDLAPKAKESLFRITQEAMQNIAKHSRATSVHLRLESRESTLRLEITDNGVGFDAAQEFPGHLGLQSMRERASAVGGELALTSEPRQGTRVAVMIATGVIT